MRMKGKDQTILFKGGGNNEEDFVVGRCSGRIAYRHKG